MKLYLDRGQCARLVFGKPKQTGVTSVWNWFKKGYRKVLRAPIVATVETEDTVTVAQPMGWLEVVEVDSSELLPWDQVPETMHTDKDRELYEFANLKTVE